MSFPLTSLPGKQSASSDDAWQGTKQNLAALIIEQMEVDMTWVCAECGAPLIYPSALCSEDKTHRGQVKEEDFWRKQRRKEAAQQDIADLFGPKDLR